MRLASIVWFCFLALAVRAADLRTMDVTTLRSLDPTLIGTGVPVAQPEALEDGISQFEANPAAVGLTAGFFQWISTNGAFNYFPNPAGSESTHADDVALFFFGANQGVAPGVEHDDNYEADYFFADVIVSNAAITDSVVNQSFAFFTTDLADQAYCDTNYDNYVAAYGTIFGSPVNGLNNRVGPPGTAYNSIGVGAYGVGAVVTTGPTLDNGRSKPDLVAPGQETSFTTPYVSGAAAVLLQAAARGDGGTNVAVASDRRTVKALLLDGALKPYDWSNATNQPLDVNYGAGVLDLYYSYEQLAGGEHAYSATNSEDAGGVHPPLSANPISALQGWDFETITNGAQMDEVNHYVFAPSAASTFTSTLVWERHANQNSINQLALFLYNATNQTLVTCSVSPVDNVQQLYVPHLPPGTYDLEVIKLGGAGAEVSADEQYALAWNIVPLTFPPLSLSSTASGAALTWPSSPTVFILQGAPSLPATGLWTNVTAPQWITNGTVYVNLGTSGSAGFYRLVR